MSACYSVGQVATVAGVTVRTLHHYDEIGLLSPTQRSPGGYRLYGEPANAAAFAEVMRSGVAPDSPAAMDLAEAHRQTTALSGALAVEWCVTTHHSTRNAPLNG